MAVRVTDGEEFRRRRRGKNIAIAAFLIALVVLFYLITVVKVGSNIG